MTPSDFENAEALFEQAMDLPPPDRRAFVEKACGGNADLRREVLSLLDVAERAEGFLEQPALADTSWTHAMIGRSIAGYEVLGLLGEGGMGVIFRARQSHPRREVAVKLIRAELLSPKAQRRFDLETEALGRLQHPGVARIYEAGTTDTPIGQLPYFAMELVEGKPLTRYAADHRLGPRDRVALIIRICDAVHHAHLNGVVHRDLKPGNVLVTNAGEPKVLDFGLARLTDADLQTPSMKTATGQILGTLGYMSPEQVRGRSEDVDLRADVYALGVLLYEILTGHMPYSTEGSLVEAARAVEEADPQPMSSWGESIPEDLETIVTKCLEKVAQRRYDSAADMAADLGRYLGHQPILARPPSTLYQVSRFTRRHRGLVAGAGVAVVALIAGLAVSVVGWSMADRARDRAETEARKATVVNGFLTRMLAAPDPWADGAEVKVVDILDQASGRIDQDLSDQPEVAATAHTTLGTTYYGLALYGKVETHYAKALELTRKTHSAEDPTLLKPLRNYGQFLIEEGRVDEAEPLARDTRTLLEAQPEADHAADGLHFLGLLAEARGEREEAVTWFSRALERSTQALGPKDEATLATEMSLGVILMQLERMDEAESPLTHVYETRRASLGDDHPGTLTALNNLAFVYQHLEENDRALEMFQRSLDTRLRVNGEESGSAFAGYNNLAVQLGRMERFEEALGHHEAAIQVANRIYGDTHPRTYIARATRGWTLFSMGRVAAAESELLASHEGMTATLGAGHWRTQRLCDQLATLYTAQGDSAQASRFSKLAN